MNLKIKIAVERVVNLIPGSRFTDYEISIIKAASLAGISQIKIAKMMKRNRIAIHKIITGKSVRSHYLAAASKAELKRFMRQQGVQS